MALAVYTLFLDVMRLTVYFNRAFVSLKFRPFEWLIFKYEKKAVVDQKCFGCGLGIRIFFPLKTAVFDFEIIQLNLPLFVDFL